MGFPDRFNWRGESAVIVEEWSPFILIGNDNRHACPLRLLVDTLLEIGLADRARAHSSKWQ